MKAHLNLTRRVMLVGCAVASADACVSQPVGTEDAIATLADIEKHLGGRIGVCAFDTRNSASIVYRADDRFALCSSYKWMLAAAVLARIDRGELALDRRLSYSATDLMDNSPRTKAHVEDESLSVSDLAAAAVEVSDNAAANLLLKLIGGPQSVTEYLRTLDNRVTRLDRIEMDLNSNLPGDLRDTTTPNATGASMRKILVGNVLSEGSRLRLIGWMKNCQTGQDRLRAGFPSQWIEGDKTGSGQNGAAVDNAIVWPPGRPPILIAAYLSGSTGSSAALNKALAAIGSVIVNTFT